jgi:hypothetical protein
VPLKLKDGMVTEVTPSSKVDLYTCVPPVIAVYVPAEVENTYKLETCEYNLFENTKSETKNNKNSVFEKKETILLNFIVFVVMF